jgi:signal transduction histidine kinase
MSAKEFAMIPGAPFGIGADCFVRRGAGTIPMGLGQVPTKALAERGLGLRGRRQPLVEDDIRWEERRKERARIAHELHDTLLQGFLGACMLLHEAVEQTPADSPSQPVLSRALRLARRAIDEGRAALRQIDTDPCAPSSLEEAFSNLLGEVTTGQGPRLRIFVQGAPRALDPTIHEQLFLIGREAVMNALRHSEATKIEVEIQYLPCLLRMFVRDDGCGMNPEVVKTERDSHWGLRGMGERAKKIGAEFSVWSRRGAGTEMRIAVPVEITRSNNGS